MNLKTTLATRIYMHTIHEIADDIQVDEHRLQALYGLLFDEDKVIAYNAAWVMTHFSAEQNSWLGSKQDELIEELFVCKQAGIRRMILTLLQRQPLAQPPRVDLLDYCLERMMLQQELPWTRALCIKLANELCRSIPELQQELRCLLELMEPELLTSALRGVRSNVLSCL